MLHLKLESGQGPTLHTDESAGSTARHQGTSFGLKKDIDWQEKSIGNRGKGDVHEMKQGQWCQDKNGRISRNGLAKADQDVNVDSYARVRRPEMRLVA